MKRFALIAGLAGLLGVVIWTDPPADFPTPVVATSPSDKAALAPPVVVDVFEADRVRLADVKAGPAPAAPVSEAPSSATVAPQPVARGPAIAALIEPAAKGPNVILSTKTGDGAAPTVASSNKARFAMQGAGDPIQPPRTRDIPGAVVLASPLVRSEPLMPGPMPGPATSQPVTSRAAIAPRSLSVPAAARNTATAPFAPRVAARTPKAGPKLAARSVVKNRPERSSLARPAARASTAMYAWKAPAPLIAPAPRVAPSPRVVNW